VGFSKSRSTLSVVVTGIWNNFIKLGIPIVALAIVALQGQRSGGRLVAALAGLGGLVVAVLTFALILKSEDFARRAGLVGAGVDVVLAEAPTARSRRRVGPCGRKMCGRVIGLVRNCWIAPAVSAIVSHLSLFAVLLVSLRVLGVSEAEVGWHSWRDSAPPLTAIGAVASSHEN
jgi:putative heme transporter